MIIYQTIKIFSGNNKEIITNIKTIKGIINNK
jgi:hypothetical protein